MIFLNIFVPVLKRGLIPMNSRPEVTLHSQILEGIPATLPTPPAGFPAGTNRAPKRSAPLSESERELALRNALRYFPPHQHNELAVEFAQELADYGHIYMYRFKPSYEIRARHLSEFPHRSKQAASIMLMLSNNLDNAVAQHPYELITYGGNGAVFQNWAQYRLTMKYLAEMTDNQVLVL
jgi:urocanate hydratase